MLRSRKKVGIVSVAAICASNLSGAAVGDNCDCDCFGHTGKVSANATITHVASAGCTPDGTGILNPPTDSKARSSDIVNCKGKAIARVEGESTWDTYENSTCEPYGTFSNVGGVLGVEAQVTRGLLTAKFAYDVELFADALHDCVACGGCETIYSRAEAFVDDAWVKIPFEICNDDTQLQLTATLTLPVCSGAQIEAEARWRIETTGAHPQIIDSGFFGSAGSASKIVVIRDAGEYRLIAQLDVTASVTASSGCDPVYDVRSCSLDIGYLVELDCNLDPSQNFSLNMPARRKPYEIAALFASIK